MQLQNKRKKPKLIAIKQPWHQMLIIEPDLAIIILL